MKKDLVKYIVPSGIAAALLLAIAIAFQSPTRPAVTPPPDGTKTQKNAVRVSRIGDSAFGALTVAGGDERAAMDIGRGGGAGLPAPAASSVPAQDPAASKMILPYEPTYYRYVYKGELQLSEEKLAVYKRRKGGSIPASASLVDMAALGLIDASRLGSLSLQSLSLAQDKEFGYFLYVDAIEGMVSLNQNYAKWPHPEQDCRDEDCFNRFRLKDSDMLSDGRAIAIADAFLKDLGVNTGSYGAPAIQNDWRVQFAAMAEGDRASYYFPDIVSVVYPLVIDGQKVHDEGGMPMGLVVNVNVRHERADGLWNLTTLDFDAASYDAADPAKVLEAAGRGGVYDGAPPTDVKVEEVELGEPERVLMRAWSGGSEVIVPALRFPVVKKPEGQAWLRDSVMIPLVKDLLEIPAPGPAMPLMKDTSEPR